MIFKKSAIQLTFISKDDLDETILLIYIVQLLSLSYSD